MRVRRLNLQDLTGGKSARPSRISSTLNSGYNAGMRRSDEITEKLREAFAPESLRVEDESHRHEGHAGHRPGGETHFRLYIVSEAFRGKSRIERHRMINAALATELSGGVHALAIHAAAPDESL
jgi:BolA family transcriptional regulator, general stress-responsive regulator